ncbi:hypothetical protein ABT294_28640 [Nonomuraea sp. NPDC000554]
MTTSVVPSGSASTSLSWTACMPRERPGAISPTPPTTILNGSPPVW